MISHRAKQRKATKPSFSERSAFFASNTKNRLCRKVPEKSCGDLKVFICRKKFENRLTLIGKSWKQNPKIGKSPTVFHGNKIQKNFKNPDISEMLSIKVKSKKNSRKTF